MAKTNPNLACDPLKSMMSGLPTTSFAQGGAEPLGDINSGLEEAAKYAASAIPTAISNVTQYAATKVGKALGETLAPPTPGEILGQAGKLVSAYLISPGDMMKELLQPAEATSDDEATKALEDSVKEMKEDVDEKIGKAKEKVDGIVTFLTETLPGITGNVKQGLGWMTDQVNYYEQQAMEQIDLFVDEQQAIMMKKKEDFVNGMASGIAEQTAKVANEELRQKTKRQIDKIKEQKEKAIIKAKALAGKALLNLMALLGL